jgi:hypothetical protein
MRLRPDSAEFKRLTRQIEQDLLNQARLRLLLSEADATVSGDRKKLRAVKARLTRARR